MGGGAGSPVLPLFLPTPMMDCLLIGNRRTHPSLAEELKGAGVKALWLCGESFPMEARVEWMREGIRIGNRPADGLPCIVLEYLPPYPHPQRRYNPVEWRNCRTDFPDLIVNESEAGSVLGSILEVAQVRGTCRPPLPTLDLCAHPEALAWTLRREGFPVGDGPGGPIRKTLLFSDGTGGLFHPNTMEEAGLSDTIKPPLDAAKAVLAFFKLPHAMVDVDKRGSILGVNPVPPWESLSRRWRTKMIQWVLESSENRP